MRSIWQSCVTSVSLLGLPAAPGTPQRLRDALDAGATGVQVGTLFAYCEESGFADQLRRDVIEHAGRGEVVVMTDPRASPTGYPFKVVEWATDAEHDHGENGCATSAICAQPTGGRMDASTTVAHQNR